MRLNDYCYRILDKATGHVLYSSIRDCHVQNADVRICLMYPPSRFTCERVPAIEKLPFSELGS